MRLHASYDEDDRDYEQRGRLREASVSKPHGSRRPNSRSNSTDRQSRRPESASGSRPSSAQSKSGPSRPTSASTSSSLTINHHGGPSGRPVSGSRGRSTSADRQRNPILMHMRYESKTSNDTDIRTEKFSLARGF